MTARDEAVKAAALALADGRTHAFVGVASRRYVAEAAVAAAWPHIEAAVRAQMNETSDA